MADPITPSTASHAGRACNIVCHSTDCLCFFQQAEIFISGHSGCFHIDPDDSYGDFVIGREDDRSAYAGFGIGAVASFLTSKSKTGGEEYLFQHFPVDRDNAWHA